MIMDLLQNLVSSALKYQFQQNDLSPQCLFFVHVLVENHDVGVYLNSERDKIIIVITEKNREMTNGFQKETTQKEGVVFAREGRILYRQKKEATEKFFEREQSMSMRKEVIEGRVGVTGVKAFSTLGLNDQLNLEQWVF